jgi:hypothetical protein
MELKILPPGNPKEAQVPVSPLGLWPAAEKPLAAAMKIPSREHQMMRNQSCSERLNETVVHVIAFSDRKKIGEPLEVIRARATSTFCSREYAIENQQQLFGVVCKVQSIPFGEVATSWTPVPELTATNKFRRSAQTTDRQFMVEFGMAANVHEVFGVVEYMTPSPTTTYIRKRGEKAIPYQFTFAAGGVVTVVHVFVEGFPIKTRPLFTFELIAM